MAAIRERERSPSKTTNVGLPSPEPARPKPIDGVIEVPAPLPGDEIFQAQGEILTARPKKTLGMLKIEDRFGTPIETLHQELYWNQGMSRRAEAKVLGVHPRTMDTWISRFELPTRSKSAAVLLSWKDEETKEKRKQGDIGSWKDLQKKAERVAKIHSPEANEKRRQSLIRAWKRRKSKTQTPVLHFSD